ncbi:glucan endo-1,6-beta-glucosidase [Gymnopus androsaceus JB14]|uniref:Glucan endo-1,6-beta-glucosidase n=1 Tax=Gymnopus androsaceus JB14 TaxID=1447944 RepID=A0A6A4HRW4_9AGAR|nr:glucan endo-1,6-beta-glucosidase [Gymnopus androsaceus JB14]
MHFSRVSVWVSLLLAVKPAASQQIWDIWQTTWDRSGLFSDVSPTTPINFVSPGAIGSADIVVDDSIIYQNIYGFGGSLTDSAALLLSELKTTNVAQYWSLLGYLFVPTDGAGAAGLNYIRVPLGASDFSADLYSYDDTNGDTSFANFNIKVAPSYVFSTLADILSLNDRFMFVPWSPPAWMKTTGTMDGGSLTSSLVPQYATYLLKCLQGFAAEGLTPYAIGIQNEPQNSDTTYPSCSMTAAVEAQIGIALRTLMNNNGFSATKIIGFEHNWSGATTYAVPLLQAAPNAFDGVSFHCYEGTVDEQLGFQTAFPDKECTGTIGSDWWSDIKVFVFHLWLRALSYYSTTGLMWNLALDGSGDPLLPGSDSCSDGCRGIVQVNSNGTWSAIIPKDVGGPFGQRIDVSVGGELSWALIVGAYVTGRVSPTDWPRYSLVVLNWDDTTDTGTFDPVPVQTTIEFRGMQATYTFPVGVTTLWWFAPNLTLASSGEEEPVAYELYSETDGKQQPLQFFQ